MAGSHNKFLLPQAAAPATETKAESKIIEESASDAHSLTSSQDTTYEALLHLSENHELIAKLKGCIEDKDYTPFLKELQQLPNFFAEGGKEMRAYYGKQTREAWGAGLAFLQSFWQEEKNCEIAENWHNEKNKYVNSLDPESKSDKPKATAPGCISFIPVKIGKERVCFLSSSRPAGRFKESEAAPDSIIIQALMDHAASLDNARLVTKENKTETKLELASAAPATTPQVEQKADAKTQQTDSSQKPLSKKQLQQQQAAAQKKQKEVEMKEKQKAERQPLPGQYRYEVISTVNENFNTLIKKLLIELGLPPAEHPDRFCAEKFFMRTMLQLIHEYPEFELEGIVNLSMYPFKVDKSGKVEMSNPRIEKPRGDGLVTLGGFQFNGIPCCKNCKRNYEPMVALALLLESNKLKELNRLQQEHLKILKMTIKGEPTETELARIKEKALVRAKIQYRSDRKKEREHEKTLFNTPIKVRKPLKGTPEGTPAHSPAQSKSVSSSPQIGGGATGAYRRGSGAGGLFTLPSSALPPALVRTQAEAGAAASTAGQRSAPGSAAGSPVITSGAASQAGTGADQFAAGTNLKIGSSPVTGSAGAGAGAEAAGTGAGAAGSSSTSDSTASKGSRLPRCNRRLF